MKSNNNNKSRKRRRSRAAVAAVLLSWIFLLSTSATTTTTNTTVTSSTPILLLHLLLSTMMTKMMFFFFQKHPPKIIIIQQYYQHPAAAAIRRTINTNIGGSSLSLFVRSLLLAQQQQQSSLIVEASSLSLSTSSRTRASSSSSSSSSCFVCSSSSSCGSSSSSSLSSLLLSSSRRTRQQQQQQRPELLLAAIITTTRRRRRIPSSCCSWLSSSSLIASSSPSLAFLAGGGKTTTRSRRREASSVSSSLLSLLPPPPTTTRGLGTGQTRRRFSTTSRTTTRMITSSYTSSTRLPPAARFSFIPTSSCPTSSLLRLSSSSSSSSSNSSSNNITTTSTSTTISTTTTTIDQQQQQQQKDEILTSSSSSSDESTSTSSSSSSSTSTTSSSISTHNTSTSFDDGIRPYQITTPIYYVNDKPHIGHAYTSTACDVIARYMRLLGRDVLFITGTDEHGQKVEKSAYDLRHLYNNNDNDNTTTTTTTTTTDPQKFVNVMSKQFQDLASALHISYDIFIRTTNEQHKRTVQKVWNQMVDNDDIYLGSYEGWYSIRDECFYSESELITTIEDDDQDQDIIVQDDDDDDEIDDEIDDDEEKKKMKETKQTKKKKTKKVAPTGSDVIWITKEPSYFFRLSKYQDALLQYYNDHPDFIAPCSRRNEVIQFIKQNDLRDLSISRTSFTWGIPVPTTTTKTTKTTTTKTTTKTDDDDTDDATTKQHVMYVWIDALTNYISALGYGSNDDNDDDDDKNNTNTSLFNQYWPASLHIVGKDILRFHAIYWPAILMSIQLPIPRRIFAHGWWTNDGIKISKSLGNVIDPKELIQQYGIDATRFFLMSEINFGNDGDFSYKNFVLKCNSNLSNELGNLCQRTLTLVYKNCNQSIPINDGLRKSSYSNNKNKIDDDDDDCCYTDEDIELLNKAQNLHVVTTKYIMNQCIREYIDVIVNIVRDTNKYIDDMEPWTLRKNPNTIERMEIVLYVICEVLRYVAILYQPIIPTSANQILDLLTIPQDQRTFHYLNEQYRIVPGTPLVGGKPKAIFPRFELPEERSIQMKKK